MKQYKTFVPSAMICSNCTQYGHQSKQCPHPITSYGVILFRIKGAWNQTAELLQGGLTGLESVKHNIEYLLIQRRDSIGFIEIMRGKYRISDTEYIKQHINGMTEPERQSLLTRPFEELWEDLWGPPQEGSHAYKNEKEQAKQKLDALKPNLEEIIKQCGPAWETPEWGFPKGRRDMGESEYACAMREMWEETNILEKNIVPIRNMEPIMEIFSGTNQVKYCHKYYLAYAEEGVGEEPLEIAAKHNVHIKREVGCVKWMNLEEAVKCIRPENEEKRQVLFRVHKILQRFCPLALFTPGAKKST
jgi:8-oxo-dGTP pyrophosphatase MutT (NUDIX family)